MKKYLIISLAFWLTGCGAQYVSQADWERVYNNELAYVSTENSGFFDDLIVNVILGVLVGTEYDSDIEVSIEKIDGIRIHSGFLAENQAIALKPGRHTFSLACTKTNRHGDEKEKDIYKDSVDIELNGGRMYLIECEENDGECRFHIKEKKAQREKYL